MAGNELVTPKGIAARLPPAEYARDVRRFGALVRSVWTERAPLLLAPDANSFDEAWFRYAISPPSPITSLCACI